MTINEKKQRVLELDGKRTKGSWFWSARTLRSEITVTDEDDEFVEETPDILHVDSDGCVHAKAADEDFILAMPDAAEVIRHQDAEINQLLRDMGKLREALQHYARLPYGGDAEAQQALTSTEQYAEMIKKAGG